ncbi:MAG: DUF4159 domain-containing protein [Verrucomicrobiae bacterium]|nr:DUF4159 domain-containing protein [Verrucomicrobiae bacterium]
MQPTASPIPHPRTRLRIALVLCLVLAGAWVALGQRSRQAPVAEPAEGELRSGLIRNPGPRSRAGVPEWTVDPAFRADVFTFARLQFRSRGRGGWRVDYPGADLNLSYRLEQLTSMRTDPHGTVVAIEDPRLFDYPFVYMSDPRSITLSREEAEILRRYLLNGGFLMVDDFWGDGMWNHIVGEFRKIFPDRDPVSLPLDHPIFNIPYPIRNKPQIPSDDSAHRTRHLPDPYRTWEDEISWESPQPADYRAFLDDRGRIVILLCWNTDLADGWEEEGSSEWFFTTYSEKSAYPIGINIVFHLLTH